MKLLEIGEKLNQVSGGNHAMYLCELCNRQALGAHHDNAYFIQQVIPNMSCPFCKEASNDNGVAK